MRERKVKAWGVMPPHKDRFFNIHLKYAIVKDVADFYNNSHLGKKFGKARIVKGLFTYKLPRRKK